MLLSDLPQEDLLEGPADRDGADDAPARREDSLEHSAERRLPLDPHERLVPPRGEGGDVPAPGDRAVRERDLPRARARPGQLGEVPFANQPARFQDPDAV